jgi:DNA-binding NarL/FixJ family response regulator
MSEKIRIAVVDDHKIVRDGISAMLLAYDDIEMVAETGDAETMLKMIRGIRPVILILDLNLPGMDGNTLANTIGTLYPDVKIMILSSDASEATILESVRIGVKAYLSKDASEEEFIKAIRAVDAGDEYYGERIAGIIFKSYLMKVAGKGTELVPEALISEREKEVIACFANGLSYK